MPNENAKIDADFNYTLTGVTDDIFQQIRRLLVDPVTGRLKCTAIISNVTVITSGAGVPGSTPSKIGDMYVDISNKKIYVAVGTTNSGDWTILN